MIGLPAMRYYDDYGAFGPECVSREAIVAFDLSSDVLWVRVKGAVNIKRVNQLGFYV